MQRTAHSYQKLDTGMYNRLASYIEKLYYDKVFYEVHRIDINIEASDLSNKIRTNLNKDLCNSSKAALDSADNLCTAKNGLKLRLSRLATNSRKRLENLQCCLHIEM